MTYGELVYFVIDTLKVISDDSHWQEEHILKQLDNYRSMLLKQRYSDIRKDIPDSNYQTICIDLMEVPAIKGMPCEGRDYLMSIKQVPTPLTIIEPKITSIDFFQGNFQYVNIDRFRFVGHNKWLKNQIYATIAPDKHLYLRSNNPQLYYLRGVRMTGIFEDTIKTFDLQCPDTGKVCDIMDAEFPLEEGLMTTLIELVVKSLAGTLYQPADKQNNAADDLSKIQDYMARNLKERHG